jgi:hypothetical protein
MQEPASIRNARPTPPQQRTIVVFGLFRGGTTMVSRCLRILGVNMGERLDERNEEDLDLQHADAARVKEIARERNGRNDVWGWKYPGCHHTIHDWYRALRNPYFVIVFRDVLASAQTELRSGYFDDLLATLATKQEHTAKMLAFAARAATEGYPLMLVSYERSILEPAMLVDQLASFFGLGAGDAARAAAIAAIDPRKGYGEGAAPPK